MASRSNRRARSAVVSSADVSCVRVAGTALPSHRPGDPADEPVWDGFEDTRRSPGRQGAEHRGGRAFATRLTCCSITSDATSSLNAPPRRIIPRTGCVHLLD
ncbi:hypothetical protein GCM10022243_07980 [Saccharothrix violaceirubra]